MGQYIATDVPCLSEVDLVITQIALQSSGFVNIYFIVL